MTTSASRKTVILFSGDLDGTQEYEAADNAASPATTQVYSIAAGATATFALPASSASPVSGVTTKAVTISKPSTYAGTLILKGSSGASDAEGIYLHPTDPDTISVDQANQSVFCIKASADVVLRLVWT